MKKIMVLGAGRGQVQLIKTAKKLGYHTIVASINGNYPGFAFADEVCYVDISKPDEVLKQAQSLKIDGIATACLDTGISALGYVCEKMNLPGLNSHSAELSGNKLLMKEAFFRNNVSTAKYKVLKSEDGLRDVENEFEFPVIIKAVDLQGSRGINVVRDESNLLKCYEDTMSETHQDFCIVEEFIDGHKFSCQAFVVNRKILFTQCYGDVTYFSKTGIPIGHYVPLCVNPEILRQSKNEVEKAINVIGFDNCVVNVDLIEKNNKVYIIELTGRIGANCLPELTSIYYGVDIYKMIVETAMGKDMTHYFYSHASCKKIPCYAKMLYSEKSGTLKDIINNNDKNENIVEITYFVEHGDEIHKFENSKDCTGQVIVKGNSLDECENFINEVSNRIEFVLE